MRCSAPLFVFLVGAAFHAALSASLESAEKEKKVAQYDGLAELRKIDQMEFEAAQKIKEAHVNVTEEKDDTRYLEAAKDGPVEGHVEDQDASTAVGAGTSDGAAHEEHSASLESAEKEEKVAQHGQMEFEAVQKTKEVQMNVTEGHNEDTCYLGAVQDGSVEGHVDDSAAGGAGNSDGAAHEESESSEETEARQ